MIHFIMTHKKETYLASVLMTLLYLCIVTTVMAGRMSRLLFLIGFDVGNLESDVSHIRSDVERIESDVSSIESDVSHIRSFGVEIDR